MQAFAKGTNAKKLFIFLWTLLALISLSFGGISLTVISRGVGMHSGCSRTYTSCIWKSAWPRMYFAQNGILGLPECGEAYITRININECESPIKSVEGIDFAQFSSLWSINGSDDDYWRNEVEYLSTDIKTLDLRSFAKEYGMLDIASIFLPKFPVLKDLTISGYDLSGRDASIVASMLRYTPFLEKLHLRQNSVVDTGAKLLARAFQYVPKLAALDLKDNDFNAGVEAIVRDRVAYTELEVA